MQAKSEYTHESRWLFHSTRNNKQFNGGGLAGYCDDRFETAPPRNSQKALLQLPKRVALVDNDGNTSAIVMFRKALYGLRQSPQ